MAQLLQNTLQPTSAESPPFHVIHALADLINVTCVVNEACYVT